MASNWCVCVRVEVCHLLFMPLEVVQLNQNTSVDILFSEQTVFQIALSHDGVFH